VTVSADKAGETAPGKAEERRALGVAGTPFIEDASQPYDYRFTNIEAGKTLHSYWTDVCESCVIKGRCTTSKQRRVRRWEHEGILERVQQRLEDDPNKMSLRCQTVEHPFGTIKAWMGATHFKMKTLKHVATEMALHVLRGERGRAPPAPSRPARPANHPAVAG
jgi:hypothetical protein